LRNLSYFKDTFSAQTNAENPSRHHEGEPQMPEEKGQNGEKEGQRRRQDEVSKSRLYLEAFEMVPRVVGSF
jgi:hypothetical protein